MTYTERTDFRSELLNKIFQETMKIENLVRSEWSPAHYFPSNEEVVYACFQLCYIVRNIAHPAFADNPDLYKRFCKECEEIKERFQKLNAKTCTEAYCGIYQVNTYLYDEAYDLISEALDIYVPNTDYDYEY